MSYCELKRKIVTARKEHTCIWCGEPIPIETKAVYRVYTFDDVFQTDYLHVECYDAMCRTDSDYIEIDGFAEGEFLRGKTPEESSRTKKSHKKEMDMYGFTIPMPYEKEIKRAQEKDIQIKNWFLNVWKKIVDFFKAKEV